MIHSTHKLPVKVNCTYIYIYTNPVKHRLLQQLHVRASGDLHFDFQEAIYILGDIQASCYM